jgi:hypothetical protein
VFAWGGLREYLQMKQMKKLRCSCLAFRFLVGAGILHPTLADAFEPVWLTEEEMDGVTAGALDSFQNVALLQNVAVIDTWTQTVAMTLPDGGTAVTSTTISCDSSCTASLSVNLATSSTVPITLQ